MAVRAGRFQQDLRKLLVNAFDEVLEELPEARRMALEAAGDALQKEVSRQIDKRVHDSNGRVKRWQEISMGSKGGYVKVAPVEEEIEDKNCTSRELTYWLEHGHPIAPLKRNRHGRIKRYVARRIDYLLFKAERQYVEGKMFYSWSKMEAAKLAKTAAEEVLTVLANDLENFMSGQVTMEGWL